MKAIIVPGITDLNKGDQALIWESYRLIKDTKIFDTINLLSSGDTKEERKLLCGQSLDAGFEMIENILPHPRRGKHINKEYVKDSKLELVRQIQNACLDFLKTKFLLSVCDKIVLVKMLFSDKTYQTIKRFQEVDTIFVKGGGFIHAYGEKTAPYFMWYFLFYVRLAQRLHKKVIFLPNSYGPFEGLTVKKQICSVFNKIDLIYAREQVSADSLGKLLNKKIPVEMDLGFFLQKGSQEEALKILNKYNLSTSDKIVGITIRPYRFPGKHNPEIFYVNYIESVVALAHHIVNKGYKVILCNQSLGPNSHEDDRNSIQDFFKNVNHPDIVWINENLTCEVLKTVYSNFHFFVGTRFHSVVFSLTSIIPSIAIGYGGNKARGIMRDLDLNDFVIQIDEVSPKTLLNMFDKAIEQYDGIKIKLSKAMPLVDESRSRLIADIKRLHKQ